MKISRDDGDVGGLRRPVSRERAAAVGLVLVAAASPQVGIVDAELQAQLLFIGTFASPVGLQLFRARQGDRLKAAVLDIVEAVASSR